VYVGALMGSNRTRGGCALLVAAALVAGCGRDDGGRPLADGERELVRGAPGWSEPLRAELRLEPVNVADWVDGRCKRSAASRADWLSANLTERQARLIDRAIARLGERRSGVWSDGCDRGRVKIGVARGGEAVVRREVRALRRLIRASRLRSVDLVAVPSTEAAVKRAQPDLTRGGRATDVVVTGPNPALNAIDVAAAIDSGSGWEELRKIARRHRVTVVLERDDALDDLR